MISTTQSAVQSLAGDVANPRLHATTERVVDEAFAEEKPTLLPLPFITFGAVLKPGRWIAGPTLRAWLALEAIITRFPTPHAGA